VHRPSKIIVFLAMLRLPRSARLKHTNQGDHCYIKIIQNDVTQDTEMNSSSDSRREVKRLVEEVKAIRVSLPAPTRGYSKYRGTKQPLIAASVHRCTCSR